tara:strand:+ start:322 stop:480 length:159 start_codon:yes stop_codon:yes gene_type:complete
MLQKKKGNRGKINEEPEAAEGADAGDVETAKLDEAETMNIDATVSDNSEADK